MVAIKPVQFIQVITAGMLQLILSSESSVVQTQILIEYQVIHNSGFYNITVVCGNWNGAYSRSQSLLFPFPFSLA